MAKSRDRFFVRTEPLAEILRGFVDGWDRRRDVGFRERSEGGHFAGNGEPTAISWLATESGVPESTVWNVVGAVHQTTALRIADPLLAAIGHPEAFHTGEINIEQR